MRGIYGGYYYGDYVKKEYIMLHEDFVKYWEDIKKEILKNIPKYVVIEVKNMFPKYFDSPKKIIIKTPKQYVSFIDNLLRKYYDKYYAMVLSKKIKTPKIIELAIKYFKVIGKPENIKPEIILNKKQEYILPVEYAFKEAQKMDIVDIKFKKINNEDYVYIKVKDREKFLKFLLEKLNYLKSVFNKIVEIKLYSIGGQLKVKFKEFKELEVTKLQPFTPTITIQEKPKTAIKPAIQTTNEEKEKEKKYKETEYWKMATIALLGFIAGNMLK